MALTNLTRQAGDDLAMLCCFFPRQLLAVSRGYVRSRLTGHFLLVAGICGDAVLSVCGNTSRIICCDVGRVGIPLCAMFSMPLCRTQTISMLELSHVYHMDSVHEW